MNTKSTFNSCYKPLRFKVMFDKTVIYIDLLRISEIIEDEYGISIWYDTDFDKPFFRILIENKVDRESMYYFLLEEIDKIFYYPRVYNLNDSDYVDSER